MSVTPEPQTPPVTQSDAPVGLSRVHSGVFSHVMWATAVKDDELARATGYSRSYVNEVRRGKRPFVSYRFADRAAEYLAVKLGETVVVTRLLFAAK